MAENFDKKFYQSVDASTRYPKKQTFKGKELMVSEMTMVTFADGETIMARYNFANQCYEYCEDDWDGRTTWYSKGFTKAVSFVEEVSIELLYASCVAIFADEIKDKLKPYQS